MKPKLRPAGRVSSWPIYCVTPKRFKVGTCGADCPVESARGSGQHRGADVAVGVQGQRDLGVAELLHDDALINLVLQQKRGAPVARVVKSDPRQLRFLHLALQVIGYIWSIQGDRSAQSMGIGPRGRSGSTGSKFCSVIACARTSLISLILGSNAASATRRMARDRCDSPGLPIYCG